MGDEYAGVILSCRRSMRPLRPRYCPMKALGEDATMSRRLVGWEVGWALEEPKIRDTTGGAGPPWASFSRGPPDRATSSRVRIHKGDRCVRGNVLILYI